MSWKGLEFSGIDSAERVRRLQALCAESAGDTGNGVFDGLLIISGVDSHHSRLSQAVIKYLFLGSSGQELLGEQVISQENDRLEDIVLVLTRYRISIFYSSESEAAIKVLPMISQWRHVTHYTYHDAMDPDEQELRKIHAFKEMIGSVKRVGIPYGVDSSEKDLQDVMIPEKWPLIQSFGLEDGNNGTGFFTMNHSVINVSTLIQNEFSKLDEFTAKRVVAEVPPMLSHHFMQFLTKLDHTESPAERQSKSESEMGEDLISFYEFGTTQHEARGIKLAAHRGSRVLFGKRTRQIRTERSSPSAFLHTINDNGVSATHMLVHSEDPFSGIRFTRTYFLATGETAPPIVDEDALVQEERSLQHVNDKDERLDTRVLIELYMILLRAFRSAVSSFAQQATKGPVGLQIGKESVLAEIKATALTKLPSSCLHEANLPSDFLQKNLEISSTWIDACGRDSMELEHGWNLVYISLTFRDVPSQINASLILGSLVVGDTLLLRNTTDTTLFNVTSSFPYFRTWIQAGQEFDSVKALLAALQSGFMLQSSALLLGTPIPPLDAAFDEAVSTTETTDPTSSIASTKAMSALLSIGLSRATVLLDCEELPVLSGNMQLFSGGFCFKTPHLIPIIVSFEKHVCCFKILSTAYDELVLLELELKQDGRGNTAVSTSVPFPFTSRFIAFPLLAGTRFQQEIVHALSVWKTTATSLGIPFYRPHDMTQFDGLTPRDTHDSEVGLPPLFASSCASLVRKTSAQSNLDVMDRLFPRWFIPKDANPLTALSKPRKTDRAKTVIPITIVLGLPGSSSLSIASTICDVSSAVYDWERVDIDCRDSECSDELYVANCIKQRVAMKLQRILDLSPFDLPPRLLLCVVGYVDAVTVAAAVKQAALTWVLPSKISTVIGCVSATNVYRPDAYGTQSPLPCLFDQLACGFTTHIVVTHSGDVPATALGRLRFHIDNVNSFADIHVLSGDVFESSFTMLLSVDRFESAYFKNYRDAHFPQWEKTVDRFGESTDPVMSPQCMHFEIAPDMDKTRFLQSVGKTLTPFAIMTKSIDKVHPSDRQQLTVRAGSGAGIRFAQSIAAEKVLEYQKKQNQGSVAPCGECWSIEATVSFAGDTETVYEYVSTGAYARIRTVKHKTSSMEIKITGRHLNALKIRELILGCYVKLDGVVQPMRTRLTIEEKREIQKQHVMDELPEGFYYDGISYIDQFGGRHEFHPQLDQFIEEHLQSLNEKTKQNNVNVEENRKSQQSFVRQLV